MTTLFAVANDRKYDLFVFDDSEDFHAVTKAVPPVAGFALSDSAFFVLNDPALEHELAHAVANSKIGVPANEFLREGLACTIFGSAKMASFDAEMKYLVGHKKLPDLRTLHGRDDPQMWIKEDPTITINLYKMGGSWLSFLFRTQGAEKTKTYYRTGNAEKAFGLTLEVLEGEWHAWLARYPLRPEASEAMARKFSPPNQTRTIIADETFHLVLGVSEEFRDYSHHLEKDGKPLPAQKGNFLLLLPAQVSDAGTYRLISIAGGESRITSELKLEVIDPRVFLPQE